MKREYIVRLLAGSVVLTGAALTHFVSEWWLLLVCFAGLNLIQSAFTGFCPPEIFLRKMGWGDACDEACRPEKSAGPGGPGDRRG